jgi:hypothetical protein
MSRFVDRFWKDAFNVLEAAAGQDAGDETPEVGILIGCTGGLHIVAVQGWTPEALLAHYGASTVYRVSRTREGVQVEGRSQNLSCVLRSTRGGAAGPLPAALPLYNLCPRALPPAPAA